MLHYEFKDGINRYLAAAADTTKYHTLAELIEFNKAQCGEGDAVVRAGDVREGGDDGAAQLAGVSPGARGLSPVVTHRGYRRDAQALSPGRARLPDRRTGVDDGPGEWGPLESGGRQLDTGGGCRLPAHHRTRRIRGWTAGGAFVHGPGVERWPAAALCVCVRAGHPGAPRADVQGQRSPRLSRAPAPDPPRRSSAPPGSPVPRSPHHLAAPTIHSDTLRASRSPHPRCHPLPDRP